ncbi:2-phospho-L-lactate guanylyltransferase [Gordonia sp. LSe1-13]|uniref:Phosphoenolpyruvate guanylyltransferase n=1 Tax=Gordonia sesuvii TaxID=3116777 RepID=A0ABU7MHW2_9ACTN|nr:2-phospho-L-lactate guanylyltransferase [Gordonia sp. LSe1-13]
MTSTSPTDPGVPRLGDVVAVLAVKRLGEAKTRLAASRSSASDGLHRELVLAMMLDTMDALRRSGIDHTVVISPDDGVLAAAHGFGAASVRESAGHGVGVDRLNQAFADAAADARRRWPTVRTVMLVQADLPAATADSFRSVVTQARGMREAVLADRDGTGTTLLVRRSDISEPPHFGPDSAAAHREAGAVELDPEHLRWADLRTDVDTADDLDAALSLGVGHHTAAALGKRHPAPDHGPAMASEPMSVTKRFRPARDAS